MKGDKGIRKAKTLTIIILFTVSFLAVPLASFIRLGSAAPSDWWDTNWSYRKSITIDHSKVSADQINFPVLISIGSDADLAANASSNGQDIVFTTTDKVKLSHEIELFDHVTGRLVAWVKIPLLSSTIDTVIQMYFDNPSAPPQWDPTGVWDTDFMEVHHFNGTSATNIDDSTTNHNDVISQTSTPIYGVESKIGKTVGFVPNEGLTIADSNSLDGFSTAATFEAWINSSNFKSATSQTVSSKWSTGNKAWFIELQYVAPKNRILFYFTQDGSTAKYAYCENTFQDSSWYHIAVVWKNNVVPIFYVNGQLQLTNRTDKTSNIFSGSANQYIGHRTMNYFNGSIDEFRISDVERSASWLATSFNNQNDPTSFFGLGSAEFVGAGGPIVSNPNPSNGVQNVGISLDNVSFLLTNADNGLMSYNVTMSPDALGGVKQGSNVPNGTTVTVPLAQTLNYSTLYMWTVQAMENSESAIRTFSFTTAPNPNQTLPTLVSGGPTNSTHDFLICTPQAGAGLHTNIYNWYKDNQAIARLLMPFDTNQAGTIKDYSGYGNNGVIDGATWTPNGFIGGAFAFDGISDRINVSDSASLGGDGSLKGLSIEFWIKLAADQKGTRIIMKKADANSSGSYMVGFNTNGPVNVLYFGIYTTFDNSFPDPIYSEAYDSSATALVKGNWYHVVCSYEAGASGLKIYLNGTLSAAKGGIKGNIVPETPTIGDEPLVIGGYTDGTRNRFFNGTLDNLAIMSKGMSGEQALQDFIQSKDGNIATATIVPQETSDTVQETWKCQVTLNNGATDFNTNMSNSLFVNIYEPLVSNETPANGTLHVATNTTQLSFYLNSYQGKKMDYTVTTSPNIGFKTGSVTGSGTVTVPISGLVPDSSYTWYLNMTDGTYQVNNVYSFRTGLITLKWTASGLTMGFSGVIIADVNGDGLEEVIQAGTGQVVCLRGDNGAQIWSQQDSDIGFFCQPEMADVNKDNALEVIVPLEFPPGCLILSARTGNVLKRFTDLSSGSITSKPVIADIDGSGYKRIFIGAEDAATSQGKLSAILYNGTDFNVINQVPVYRPCSGGFSIADANNDGIFELYFGDRTPGGDNNSLARSVVCFNAATLAVIWARPDLGGAFSSHCPMLADVNNDGKLEVIVENQRGGIFVLDSSDGHTIRGDTQLYIPAHYQPSIYDIDHDGNLEMLSSDGEHPSANPTDTRVWDLVQWKEDARFDTGLCIYGPQIGEVTGDGIMDIVSCNFTGVFIISYNMTSQKYEIRDAVLGLSPNLAYGVMQDIDNDGLNEIVVASMGGKVYAFDTPAAHPSPRARSEVHFYSERRVGVAEYVPLPGAQAPIVSNPNPPNGANGVTIQLAQLSFNLQDLQNNMMNYTVTTSPYIGSGSGTNVGNAMYSVSVSNLQYNTTYTWRVSATDGTYWSNVTFVFTTVASAPPQLYNYSYRKQITIAKVSTSLTDFPVLINVTDPDLASKAMSNGQDIFFTDSNLIKLSHEIELYNSTNGQLIAWVRVPVLSSAGSTTLYMYYGNLTTVPPQWDPQNVWNSNFVEVHHLGGSSATALKDSTSNHNDVIGQTGTPNYNVLAKIGNGVDFVPNEALTINDSATLDNFTTAVTFETWICSDNYQLTQTVASKWGSAGNKSWFIEIQYTGSTNKILFYFTEDGTTAKYVYCTFAMLAGNWYNIAVVWRSNAVPLFYVNGGKQSTIGTANSTKIFAGSANEIIGSRGANYFNGKIDELRISNAVLSAAWISTSYNNQNDPVNFSHFGTEEHLQ